MSAWLWATMAWGQASVAEQFLLANQAYDEGDYIAAVEQYEALVAAGQGGRVHYNLGNAYLRTGALGRAIVAYRRAEADLPRDGDLQANLSFARQAARDAIAPPAPSAVARTVLFWHYALSASELRLAAGVGNVMFWIALAARRIRPDAEVWRWATWGLGIPLFAVLGSLLAHQVWPDPTVVVIADQVEIRAGTDEDAVVRFTLHEGTEARRVDRHEGWSRLALADGNGGWVPDEAIAAVR